MHLFAPRDPILPFLMSCQQRPFTQSLIVSCERQVRCSTYRLETSVGSSSEAAYS